MKLFLLICIFLSGSCIASAQALEADSLFREGKYLLAAVYYEKALFEKDSSGAQTSYLLKKVECYKALGNYQKALNDLKRINPDTSDELDKKVQLEVVILHYLLDEYPLAYNHLLKMKLRNPEANKDIILLESLLLVALNRWEEARSLMLENALVLEVSQKDIEKIFPEKLKLKDPEKAFMLSLLLPGVGQMYAGYPLKGLVSGAVQTLLVGFSAYSILNGYFFTGGMTGVASFYTFYFGGARHAKQLAERKNNEVTQEINSNINRTILE